VAYLASSLEKAGQHDLRFSDTMTSDLSEEETRKIMP
jgi:hypothetical protein